MYIGIVDFRLKSFNSDNSLTALTNFGEVSAERLVLLKNLSDNREVGMVICDVEHIKDVENLLRQLKELKELDEG